MAVSPGDQLALELTFSDSGEVVILWRQPGQDWRLAPAPPDIAPDLRRLRAYLLGGAELVSEPEELLAPLPQLESLAGPSYPAARIIDAAARLALEEL